MWWGSPMPGARVASPAASKEVSMEMLCGKCGKDLSDFEFEENGELCNECYDVELIDRMLERRA